MLPDGTIGDSYTEIKPADPHYQEILAHIGGLKPGEEKSVPPWPDQKGTTESGPKK